MIDAEKMSPSELRALARKKEQELMEKPTKEGFLKEDLYQYIPPLGVGNFLGKTEKENIEKTTVLFRKVCDKGTRFVLHDYSVYWESDEPGQIFFRADNVLIAGLLENIKEI